MTSSSSNIRDGNFLDISLQRGILARQMTEAQLLASDWHTRSIHVIHPTSEKPDFGCLQYFCRVSSMLVLL